MYNVYMLNGNIAENIFQLAVVPFYFKEYHEDHGKTQWNWFSETNISYEDLEKKFKKNVPHIVGISVYLWNFRYLYKIAKQIKQNYPNVLIVSGGPQVEYDFDENFLQNHKFIDLVVPDQGEETFSMLLDNFVIQNVYATPNIIYRNRFGQRVDNPKYYKKSTRVWESQWVIKHKDDIKLWVDNNRKRNKNKILSLIYETTRGCPYKCTYCDWGGGTYTKTKKKPIDIVKKELEILAQLGIDSLHIGDANWGMYPEDIEISKYLIEIKEKYGYPDSITIDSSKNNHERNIETLEILSEAQLVPVGHLSIQDTDNEVLKRTERITPDWKKQVESAIELHKKTGIFWHMQLIYGLPGQTNATIKNTIADVLETEIVTNCIYPRFSHLMILPNSPLAKEPTRSQQGLQYMYRKMLYNEYPIKPKNQKIYEKYLEYGLPITELEFDDEICLVKSTYSYDSSFLSKVSLTTSILATMQSYQLIQPYLNFLDKQHVRPFIELLILEIFEESGRIHNLFEDVYNVHLNWVNGEQRILEIDLGNDFEFTLQFETAIRYLVLEKINHISKVLVDIGKKLNYNLETIDNWLPSFVFNSKYYPGKIVEYVDHKTSKTVKYQLNDKTVPNDKHIIPIEWHKYDGIHKKQTLIFNCCIGRNGTRIAKNIKEVTNE